MHRHLHLVLNILVGVAFGLGPYTFVYAKGYSYMTNDPRACANCHVMQEHSDVKGNERIRKRQGPVTVDGG